MCCRIRSRLGRMVRGRWCGALFVSGCFVFCLVTVGRTDKNEEEDDEVDVVAVDEDEDDRKE